MATRKKAGTTANGKKRPRQSPSVERQIALALVRVIECVIDVEQYRGELEKLSNGEANPDFESACDNRKLALEEAHKVLEANGYGDLESIQSRVAAINDQLNAAFSLRDGKAIVKLGVELERAKTGRPPVAQPKKAKTPKEPKADSQPKLLPDDKAESNAVSPGSTVPESGTGTNA